MILKQLEHFYGAILMHIHRDNADNTELTNIVKEFTGKYKNIKFKNKLIETFTS